MKVADLGGPAVIFASNTVKILNAKGELIYKSDTYGTINSIDVGDLNDDSSPDIVFGSKDHNVRAINGKNYVLEAKAIHYLDLANQAYTAKDYNLTAYYATEANTYYGIIGKDTGKANAQSLLTKAGSYSDGARYYNLSQYYFDRQDYKSSIEYADKAALAYKQMSDLRSLEGVNQLRTKADLTPKASVYLDGARAALTGHKYSEAINLAQNAQSAYTTLTNTSQVQEAQGIGERAQKYLNYFSELDRAYNYTLYEDQGNATVHLNQALTIYNSLNDTYIRPQYDNISAKVSGMKQKQDVLVYGSLSVLALVALLLFAAVALIVALFLQKGGVKMFSGIFSRDERSPWDRKQPDGGGLRELRGRRGESIGDSFKKK